MYMRLNKKMHITVRRNEHLDLSLRLDAADFKRIAQRLRRKPVTVKRSGWPNVWYYIDHEVAPNRTIQYTYFPTSNEELLGRSQ